MAYIKNIKVKQNVQKCIDYITDPKKTMEGKFVSYEGTNPECANLIWEGIRKRFGKDSGIKAHHFIQSFDPKHGVTPEEAQKIGMDLAGEQFGKYGFEFIVATHVDTGKIHNHILVNAVSSKTGKKYQHNDSRDFKKNPNSYIRLRQLNIDICRKYGIPAMDSPKLDEKLEESEQGINIARKYSTSVKYIKTKSYDSWTEKQLMRKDRIRADIDNAVKESANWDEYLDIMKSKGYEIKWKRADGSARRNVTYIMPGGERGRRDDALNFKNKKGEVIDRYSREAIEKRIKENTDAERTSTVNIELIQYKKIQVKGSFLFKGFYFEGTRYFLHPKYRIIHRRGKTYYIKRNLVETWYIKRFLKMPEKLVRVNGRIKGQSAFSKQEEEWLNARIAKTIKKCNLISKHHIGTSGDAEKARLQYVIHKQNVLWQIEKKKAEIMENDRMNNLVNIMESYQGMAGEYEAMSEGKEKNDFYYRNKEKLQKYQYAYREWIRAGYVMEDLPVIKDTRMRLYAEMEILENEKKECESNIAYIEEISSEIRSKEEITEKEKGRDTRDKKDKE